MTTLQLAFAEAETAVVPVVALNRAVLMILWGEFFSLFWSKDVAVLVFLGSFHLFVNVLIDDFVSTFVVLLLPVIDGPV